MEKFLRSGSEAITCGNFNSIYEAREFALLIDGLAAANKFSVTTRTFGSGRSSRCLITKLRDYHSVVKENAASIKTSLTNLARLKMKLLTLRDPVISSNSDPPISDAANSAPDDVLIVPSIKRARIDVPVVDLD